MTQKQREYIAKAFSSIMSMQIGDTDRMKFIHEDTKILLTIMSKKTKNKNEYRVCVYLNRYEPDGFKSIYSECDSIAPIEFNATIEKHYRKIIALILDFSKEQK
ncbi:MAG: hypothetical protein FWG98_06915 [Candidatus Cloacimonetes bacterium]|nr:hypothetical protein [Candidatus Cloacimonadota bacterium]